MSIDEIKNHVRIWRYTTHTHPIFRKINLPTTLFTPFASPTYQTCHTIRITTICIIYLQLRTTLSTSFASSTFTYLPHFSHHSHHLPSPIYHTFHSARTTYVHLSTVLFTPFALPTFTYLSHYTNTNTPSLDLSRNPYRPVWRPVTDIWIL